MVKLAEPQAASLRPFLHPHAILVPVPRSSPLPDGALWPASVIAEVLATNGYGAELRPLVERVTAVQKSSTSPARERPLIHEHMQSMAVQRELIRPPQITLIDDVLTMGRTTLACALLLREAYPGSEIRIFAMLRTLGLVEDIDAIFDPTVGKITGYDSGKAFRDP